MNTTRANLGPILCMKRNNRKKIAQLLTNEEPLITCFCSQLTCRLATFQLLSLVKRMYWGFGKKQDRLFLNAFEKHGSVGVCMASDGLVSWRLPVLDCAWKWTALVFKIVYLSVSIIICEASVADYEYGLHVSGWVMNSCASRKSSCVELAECKCWMQNNSFVVWTYRRGAEKLLDFRLEFLFSEGGHNLSSSNLLGCRGDSITQPWQCVLLGSSDKSTPTAMQKIWIAGPLNISVSPVAAERVSIPKFIPSERHWTGEPRITSEEVRWSLNTQLWLLLLHSVMTSDGILVSPYCCPSITWKTGCPVRSRLVWETIFIHNAENTWQRGVSRKSPYLAAG